MDSQTGERGGRMILGVVFGVAGLACLFYDHIDRLICRYQQKQIMGDMVIRGEDGDR